MKQNLGRVRRRTSTKQRSMRLVVRSFRQSAGEVEEAEQFRQVFLQLPHDSFFLLTRKVH